MRLTEVHFSSSDLAIDSEQGVIRGVKVLGRESRNGRTYSETAISRALTKYEGAKVYLNHDRKNERQIQEHFGQIRSANIRPDGIYGDLHYLTSHPMAAPIAESAQKFPRDFGLSHTVEGVVAKRGRGKNESIEEITEVFSVDIVTDPATTAGLFESEERPKMATKKLGEILKDQSGKTVDFLQGVIEKKLLTESDEIEFEDGGDEIEAAVQHFASKRLAEGHEAFIKSLGDLFTPPKQATQKTVEKGSESSMAEILESVKTLTEQVKELRGLGAKEKAVRRLETAGIEATDERVDLLTESSDPDKLLKTWPKKGVSSRTTGVLSPPSTGGNASKAIIESFAERVKRATTRV